MVQFNGPTYIATPMAPQRPYGLFDVALGPMEFPDRNLGGGVIYVPDTCVDDYGIVDFTCPPITGAKAFSGIEFPVSGAPFAVYTSYTCGSIGFSFEEVRDRLLTRMALHEQKAVEQRLWQGSTGNGGTIPGLFRNATNLGAASCVTEAVEMLEQVLADNGIVGGLIHARPGLSAHLAQAHLVERGQGRRRTTVTDTPYVFGQGYDGSGPTGQAATTDVEWMYASGRVLVWQDSTIEIPPIRQTMDRTTNQIYALAERVYAVAVECGVWAVQVTRNCTTAGST